MSKIKLMPQKQNTTQECRGRGRPRTDTPREISTVRTRRMKAQLEAEGGRELNRVRLSPEANQALTYLLEGDKTEREAIQRALIDQAARRQKQKK